MQGGDDRREERDKVLEARSESCEAVETVAIPAITSSVG